MLEVLHTLQSSFPSACTSPGTVQLWHVGPSATWLAAEDTSSPSACKDGQCTEDLVASSPPVPVPPVHTAGQLPPTEAHPRAFIHCLKCYTVPCYVP